MSVLVFAENWEGKFKKSTFEAVSYAHAIAKQLSTGTVALAIGPVNEEDLKNLGKYGADKVISVRQEQLNNFDAQGFSSVIIQAAQKEAATVVVISYTYTGKNISGRVAAGMKAGLVAGTTALPSAISPFTVRKKCFSGKALTDVVVSSETKVLALTPNSFSVVSMEGSAIVESFDPKFKEGAFRTRVKEVKKNSDKVVLTEAELVVSAGRGMKGPENWGMIEDLANQLGAGLACSKPVADMDWRPHHEHVGQTGITIGPNLYVAIGISGAIQHLAGVSSSKVIVVINSDPEAPFFKAADYGVVGDAFEVVPRLIAAVKNFKAGHS